MSPTLSHGKLSQEMESYEMKSHQGTTKLKKFLEEQAAIMKLKSLTNLLNESMEKHKLKKINLLESPVATSVNGDSILNLSRIGSTPEKSSKNIVNAVTKFRNNDIKIMQKNNFKSNHKNITVTNSSKKLIQTYKYSNTNSTGTKRLNRFPQQYSQEPWNQPPSNLINKSKEKNTFQAYNLENSFSSNTSESSSGSLNGCTQNKLLQKNSLENIITLKNPLDKLKRNRLKYYQYKAMKNLNLLRAKMYCDKLSITGSLTSILNKSSLLGYEETKNIQHNSLEKNSHMNYSNRSVFSINSFHERETLRSMSGMSSSSISKVEVLNGCARTRIYRDLRVALRKGNQKNCNKKMTNIRSDKRKTQDILHNSPLCKGLDLIEKFTEKYEKRTFNNSSTQKTRHKSPSDSNNEIKRKSRSRILDRWVKNNPIGATNDIIVNSNNFSLESKSKNKSCRTKNSSEISFLTKSRSSYVLKRKPLKIGKLQTIYEKSPKPNRKIYEKVLSKVNTIPKYFSQRKIIGGKDNIIHQHCNRNSDGKNNITSENMETGTRNILNSNENSVVRGKKHKGYEEWLTNYMEWIDAIEKPNSPVEDVVKNSNNDPKVETKKNAEINLDSSEGFFESMSLKTPLGNVDDNKKHDISQNSTKNHLNSSQTKHLSTYPFTNIQITKCKSKNTEVTSSRGFTCLEPQKLPDKTQRKKLSLSEERELSPDFYVMKMCGPESQELVENILNSYKHTKVESSLNNSENLEKGSGKSLYLNNTFNNQEFGSRNCLDQMKRREDCKKFDRNVLYKDSLSDPLSFGSPSVNFSGNANFREKDKESHYTLKSHCPSMENKCPSTNQAVQNNSEIIRNGEKLDRQVLKSLHQLHESTSWNTQEQTKFLKSSYHLDKKHGTSSLSQSMVNTNQDVKQNKGLKSLKEAPIKKQKCEQGTNSQLTNRNTISSEIFTTQSNPTVTLSPDLNENVQSISTANKRKMIFKIEDNPADINKNVSEEVYQSQNIIDDPFLFKVLTQNFEDVINRDDIEPKCFENSENKESQKQVEMDAYQTKENYESAKLNVDHDATNYKKFEQMSETQIQTENLENQINTQKINKKMNKTYNITEDSILYKDNLLKNLIEDKQNVWKMSGKKKVLPRRNSEESVKYRSRNCIKRYKKGGTKIFKIKRRFKRTEVENYKPPEGQIMDRFLKRLDNDFNSSNSDSAYKENCQSISTPISYVTDETKSEVLSTGSTKLTDAQKLLRQGINKLSKDRSLLFSKFDDSVPREFDKYEIIANIEQIVNGVLEDFEQGKNLRFRIPKENVYNCFFADGRYQRKEPPDYTTVYYNVSTSRQKFNLILFLLNKIKLLLETDTKLTKREIYYQLKTTVKCQGTTDRALKDICKMLNVGLWALNVTAQKGLVYGNLKLVMADGEVINCNVPGTLIPQDISKICELQSTAYFILVVEKESIYHKLLEENLPNRLTRPFILITGKGFPDLNTQLFLKKLWMIMSIPVFIFVDADPDGIAIMLNYRFGSIANAHVSEHLAIPKARWLGVFPTEILRLNLSHENLCKREISMAQKLLQLECVQENEKIKIQLEKLLENGIKTGIEALIKTDTYLSNCYLYRKFLTNNLI